MKIFFSLMIFGLLTQLLDCSSSANQEQVALNEPQTLESTARPSNPTPEEHFKSYCSGCHGHGVKTFVDRKWKYGETKEALVAVIKKGIPDQGMPAYEKTFSEQELEALAEYILEGIQDRASYSTKEIPTPKYYKTQAYNLQVDTMVSNVGIPWGIKVTKDGTIYFTQKEGKLKSLTPDGILTEMGNVPSVVENIQGGLMDIALHPDFETNKLIYLSYTKRIGTLKTTTAVIKAKIQEDSLVDIEDIFEAVPASTKNYHYGSRLVFDKDGYLYITVGDRANRDNNPQNLDNSCGKVHRVHDDGTIPADNPFVDNEAAIQSIWSYGHRNPQGMIYDHQADRLWTNEHGPRGGDELNLIQRSKNYGWPAISYGINYDGTTFTTITEKEGLLQPINYWTPSIAPSGMALVTGPNYDAWQGNVLSGSMRFRYVSRIETDGEKVISEERILENIGRVRSIEMGADGFLYIGVEDPGRILKVTVTQ